MMGQRVLLDSDILSEVLKGHDLLVSARAKTYVEQFAVLSFTSASVLEILHGLHCKSALVKIQRSEAVFRKNDEVVPSRGDYRLAAEISGALARQGTPIGLMDPLIAACAIRHGYGVATGNTAHFGYIHRAGYPFYVENWRV